MIRELVEVEVEAFHTRREAQALIRVLVEVHGASQELALEHAVVAHIDVADVDEVVLAVTAENVRIIADDVRAVEVEAEAFHQGEVDVGEVVRAVTVVTANVTVPLVGVDVLVVVIGAVVVGVVQGVLCEVVDIVHGVEAPIPVDMTVSDIGVLDVAHDMAHNRVELNGIEGATITTWI